ncbi:unnamed protein product [Dovyalis caffra]|uniref:Uncharacterized protein n=1 Tax=Dovyalis caffra TaxID=77055 RepID=A0AAV1RPJ1_9ROSI|nr:unnamed protein product [Dovyalis caffra]
MARVLGGATFGIARGVAIGTTRGMTRTIVIARGFEQLDGLLNIFLMLWNDYGLEGNCSYDEEGAIKKFSHKDAFPFSSG